jgi:hypothetical protein
MIQLNPKMEPAVSSEQGPAGRPRWLLLIHRLPPKPDYLRVKVHRRLRRLGARALKNSVYVLPNADEHLEDFTWLRREIVADGGEALICEANFVEGITDAAIEGLVRGDAPARVEPGPGGDRVPRGTTWVTRRGIGVDRMGSAWLIRRFIDPEARFRFVAPHGFHPAPGEVRFDMYDGEYTHEGDACTFETLRRRFRLERPALGTLAEIVHDIDCKDDRFERREAAGVALVVESIAAAHPGDDARLERGMALFDELLARLEHGPDGA